MITMGSGKKAQVRRLVPIGTALLILILGFFAFRGGVGLGPSGAVTLRNSSVLSTLVIGDEISVPVENTIVRLSSSELIHMETDGRELDASTSLWLDDFEGTIAWDGEHLVVKGTMKSANGNGVSVSWSKRERATITMQSGVVDVATTNLSSFGQDATGRLTLEGRWTASLNETPVDLDDFEGRVYLQRLNNETSMTLEGRAEVVSIEEDNLLRSLT